MQVWFKWNRYIGAGKSFSEGLILASTNPQYDKRLFIDFPVLTWKLQAQNILCTQIVLNVKTKKKTICVHNIEVFMYWTGKSINNLLSYCGLVDTRISPSEKDLPVPTFFNCSTYNQS